VTVIRYGFVTAFISALALIVLSPVRADEAQVAKVRILLMGDSTVIGTVPREVAPKADHLEDIIRKLLASEKDLPPLEILNQGRNGEFIHSLLTSRYDQEIAKIPELDFILIRYGINDRVRREDFFTDFTQDYRQLLQRLRADHPQAQIILQTIIPYLDDQRDADANYVIHLIAESEKLPLLDMHARFAAELKKHGPNTLTYRQAPVKDIPEKYRPLIPEGSLCYGYLVVILDNLLDAQLGDIPGWFDRHPNLAGYHVIGDETAKFLAPRLRALANDRAAANGDPRP
jgi:lysophospholipase L1-like esterase